MSREVSASTEVGEEIFEPVPVDVRRELGPNLELGVQVPSTWREQDLPAELARPAVNNPVLSANWSWLRGRRWGLGLLPSVELALGPAGPLDRTTGVVMPVELHGGWGPNRWSLQFGPVLSFDGRQMVSSVTAERSLASGITLAATTSGVCNSAWRSWQVVSSLSASWEPIEGLAAQVLAGHRPRLGADHRSEWLAFGQVQVTF